MLDNCIFMKEAEAVGAAPSSFTRPGGLYITQSAIDFCRFVTGAVIADIGCGSCGTLEYLLTTCGICGFGLDPEPPRLTTDARGIWRPQVVRGVAEALPFKDNLLDGLFCECVLSLVTNLDAALMEFSRVLKKGGHLIVSDLYYRTSTDGGGPDVTYGQSTLPITLSKRGIERLLDAHGFTLLVWEDYTMALKELAARLILAGCSPDEFWKQGCRDRTPSPLGRSLMIAKPGYCLVIARRPTS